MKAGISVEFFGKGQGEIDRLTAELEYERYQNKNALEEMTRRGTLLVEQSIQIQALIAERDNALAELSDLKKRISH